MRSWPAPDVPTLPGHGDPVRLYDTAAGELLPVAPDGGPVTVYVCGITPYDATHLGHAATYVGYDVLVRTLRDAGRDVVYTQNVTDVDDPLLERADQIGVDWEELAEDQTDLFRADMRTMRVVPPDHYVGAVEAIPLVVDAVSQMLADGTAYRVALPDGAGGLRPELGDVYADLSTDPRFGTVSHLDEDRMIKVFAENGGDPDRPGKRHPLDPLLWRRTRPGEPAWDGGDLGRGRPGWHIECACIALDRLGPVCDVQGGGRDLIFPHHEMSESHLRVLVGDPRPVGVHSHGGLVAYEGEKMSKSLGNLVLVSRLTAQGIDPAAVRLAILDEHYREDWEYVDAQLAAAADRLETWRRAVALPAGPDPDGLLAEMRAALADDLDTPAALAAVDDWAERALAGTGDADGAGDLVRRAVDALLGVHL